MEYERVRNNIDEDEKLQATIRMCTVAQNIEILKTLKEMGLLTEQECQDISRDVNEYYGRPLIL